VCTRTCVCGCGWMGVGDGVLVCACGWRCVSCRFANQMGQDLDRDLCQPNPRRSVMTSVLLMDSQPALGHATTCTCRKRGEG
jgi:hypothetical protein